MNVFGGIVALLGNRLKCQQDNRSYLELISQLLECNEERRPWHSGLVPTKVASKLFMRPPWSNLSSVVALVELLISDARYVLTVDDKRRIIRDGAVAIEDMEIVDVGKSSELKRKYSAAERIDAQGKL